MATDTIIIDGDQVIFKSAMGAADVTVKPGVMKASGKTTINGIAVCVAGDEKKVAVANCDYKTATHDQPGKGTLKISALASDQLASHTNSGKKALILEGSQFDAVFEVLIPAMDTSLVSSGGPLVPDTTGTYAGKGELVSSIKKIKAT